MSILEDVSQWRVLMVDDEPDNLTLASEFLTFSGATVAVAELGSRLLEMVDEFHPNIILLDLAMPVMDGWEVQRRLRARPELNAVPIIALTALAMPEDMARAKEAGFDGYITKPFRVMSLLRDVKLCVQTFLERQKAAESSNPITEEIKKSSVTEEIKNERTNEPTQPMEDHPGG